MRLGIRFVVCSTLFFRIAIWARLCVLFSRIPLCLIQISQWNYLFRWERHIWRPATRNFVSICHERNMCENVKQNSYSTFIFTMISRVPEIRFHSRNKQQQNTLCIILPSNKFPQIFFSFACWFWFEQYFHSRHSTTVCCWMIRKDDAILNFAIEWIHCAECLLYVGKRHSFIPRSPVRVAYSTALALYIYSDIWMDSIYIAPNIQQHI